MNLTISTHHTELTEGLEAAVRDKFSRFQMHAEGAANAQEAKKTGGDAINVHVVLRVDSGQHVVEATVNGLGTKPLVARTEQKDMYAAINEASRVIDRQWRKQKTASLASRRKDSIKKMAV